MKKCNLSTGFWRMKLHFNEKGVRGEYTMSAKPPHSNILLLSLTLTPYFASNFRSLILQHTPSAKDLQLSPKYPVLKNMDLRECCKRLALFETETVNRIVNEKQNTIRTIDCKIACDTSKDKKTPFFENHFCKNLAHFHPIIAISCVFL